MKRVIKITVLGFALFVLSGCGVITHTYGVKAKGIAEFKPNVVSDIEKFRSRVSQEGIAEMDSFIRRTFEEIDKHKRKLKEMARKSNTENRYYIIYDKRSNPKGKL